MFCVSTSGIVPELSKPGMGLIFNSGTLPDTYFYWGFVRTGGLSLRWFKDHVARHEGDGSYYGTLSEGAAKGSCRRWRRAVPPFTLRADTAKRKRQAGASST